MNPSEGMACVYGISLSQITDRSKGNVTSMVPIMYELPVADKLLCLAVLMFSQ